MRRPAAIIYRKELLDTLRDRRTLAAMLLVPMVAYPVALLVTSETIAVERRAQESRRVVVDVVSPLPTPVIVGLGSDPDLRVRLSTSAASREDPKTRARLARSAIADGGDVSIAMTATAVEAFDALGTSAVELYFDPSTPFGEGSVRRVERTLRRLDATFRAQRMVDADLPPTAADPLKLERRSLASDEAIQNQFLASLLPALVLVFIAISCFYPAVDLTAGEKERRTLATLLTAPVPPIHIVWGKYLAVVTIGTLAGLLNVIVLGLTFLRVMSADPSIGPIHFTPTPITLLGLFVAIVSIAAPLAAVMLLFACFARSFRDASYLLTPVLLVAAVPAILSALPTFELTPQLAAIPLANAALLMKASIASTPPLGALAIVPVVAFATTGVLLALVERVFADERVLFSTDGRRADLKSLFSRAPRASVETALALGAGVFVLDYYAGLFTSGTSPVVGVVITQIVCHLGVAIAFAAWMAAVIPWREMLAARAPGARGWLGGVLIGGGAWLGISLPAAWITAWLVPGQAEASEAFSAALDLGEIPIVFVMLALAVVPAVCEELLFRGVLYRLMCGTISPRAAVAAQALVFGLFHGSIYRLLPTAALGFVLGELRRRTGSVVPGIIAHALTNGTILLLELEAPRAWVNQLAEPTVWALLGVGAVALAHVVVRAQREPTEG